MRCPCGTGEVYRLCCGRYLVGESAAPTAVALMRSRYTAFAVGNADYLLATWHHRTRPAELELDAGVRWLHLTVNCSSRGGPFDNRGTVDFLAVYRDLGGRGELREHSRFVREQGRWYYVDGDLIPE